ncbi:MAG: hypothetical protein DI536_28365 [Archangium gephyra]|uniref:Uncharacterized protein n=1 Tax=Archangium gephyra TaxID=48 RepID=A0A2W5T6S7_9BACT|nr:MAG: hypothetical protein DI536_28365 [Archangium gephyra]
MKRFMSDESTLLRIEALLVSLRDQVDHLTERVDARLADQQQQLLQLRRSARITKPAAARRGETRGVVEQ